MTYLDTHVLVWIYSGDVGKLSSAAADAVQNDDLLISPMVILELEYLYEIGRAKTPPPKVIETLSNDIGLSICQLPFSAVVESALDQKWVRDPFDRLIVAHASANDAPLITRDQKIRRHYRRAVW